jgi:hypothetical protein
MIDDRWITIYSFRTNDGRKIDYCYLPFTGLRAYIDHDTNEILTEQEVAKAI